MAPQVRTDRQLGLERSPRLGHTTGRNWFFAALMKDARERGGELAEWLNEADTAAVPSPRPSRWMIGCGYRTRTGRPPGPRTARR
ncbi:MAG: hypothetical protein ABSB76_40470 [Streptosporangiaceae bacterium]